jgi:hypothetical protein
MGIFCIEVCDAVVSSILIKVKAGGVAQKVVVGVEVAGALAIFVLAQGVHQAELDAAAAGWQEKNNTNDTAVSLSVAASVFKLVQKHCTCLGIVTPVPHVKVAALAIQAGCCTYGGTVKAGIKVVQKSVKEKKSIKN